MKVLPQIKVPSINLDSCTEKALITTIDIFSFIYRSSNSYITVLLGGSDDYDHLDEIELSVSDSVSGIPAEKLEVIALDWIGKHVKLAKS